GPGWLVTTWVVAPPRCPPSAPGALPRVPPRSSAVPCCCSSAHVVAMDRVLHFSYGCSNSATGGRRRRVPTHADDRPGPARRPAAAAPVRALGRPEPAARHASDGVAGAGPRTAGGGVRRRRVHAPGRPQPHGGRRRPAAHGHRLPPQ